MVDRHAVSLPINHAGGKDRRSGQRAPVPAPAWTLSARRRFCLVTQRRPTRKCALAAFVFYRVGTALGSIGRIYRRTAARDPIRRYHWLDDYRQQWRRVTDGGSRGQVVVRHRLGGAGSMLTMSRQRSWTGCAECAAGGDGNATGCPSHRGTGGAQAHPDGKACRTGNGGRRCGGNNGRRHIARQRTANISGWQSARADAAGRGSGVSCRTWALRGTPIVRLPRGCSMEKTGGKRLRVCRRTSRAAKNSARNQPPATSLLSTAGCLLRPAGARFRPCR